MKKIFIRSGMSPNDDFSIEHCIAEDVYGSNIGNLLYAYSIYRALMIDEDVIFEPNYYKSNLERADEINETCQYFIIPLADAFRKDFVYELRNLTELIKKLTIPCVVTGVGLRASYEPDFSTPFSFDDDVKAFVSAVLEKSAMLGLRGELTASYLKRLGFREEKDFTVIGCPSMYSKGGRLSVKEEQITESSKVCVNSSIYIPHEINDFVMENRKCFPDSYFIPQQTSELRLFYTGAPYNGGVKYGNYPARITDPLFAEGRYKAFFDVPSWIDFMSEADFSFGGRLHGNVAAALGGIPSLMIASDARMRELSEYHGMACVSMEEMKKAKDIFELIEKADFKRVIQKQEMNFEHFKDFLEINELDNIYSRQMTGEAPIDKLFSARKKGEVKNMALCSNEEKLERIDSFYYAFNRVYDRCANGYKEMFGVHENDERNLEAIRMEKQVLLDEVENYQRKDSVSHVVVETAFLPEKELLDFMNCVEEVFGEEKGRIIHLLIARTSQNTVRICRHRKEIFPNYMIEEDVEASLLRTKMFPFYYFEGNMEFWEKLFTSQNVPKGVCLAFLSDFMWKTCNNVMWPYNYDEEKLQKARERVTGIINKIPDEWLVGYKGVDNFHKCYLLGWKSEGETKAEVAENSLQVVRNGAVVYEAKKLEIVLTKFHPVKNRIRMVAFIKSPVFNFCEKPVLWMEENGDTKNRKEVPLMKSSWRFYKTKEETNVFYTFVLNIDTTQVKKFHFYVEVMGVLYDTYYYFMPEVIFNTALGRYRCYRKKTEYRFDHNTFLVNEVKTGVVNWYREHISEQFMQAEPEVYEFRNQIYQKRQENRKIWIYYDCKGVYKDNGYLQFVHDFEMEDGVERYYILNNELDSCRELFTEEQLPFVIPFGSSEHKMLYCLADKVITAYIEKNNYLPFTDDEYAKVMDVATMPMIVYLQHGVYHAYIPWKYSLDRLTLDKKVISAKFERKQDLEEHCFTKMYEIPSCMPRYDFLDASKKPEKKILFAPSWRKYLVDMVKNEWVTREDIFLESRFFKETSAFLNNGELVRFLKKHGYCLEFKLHPILKRYEHLYSLEGETVKMAPEGGNEEEYAIFITDFSSYIYDFIYLKRAILYFFADYEEFRSGMNDYREVVMPFKEGEIKFTTCAEEAVRCLKKMVRHNGRVPAKISKKMDAMFYHKDRGARQRIYESLMPPERR